LEKKGVHIDETAIRTGLTKRALRYYEDLGLITPLRTESGYRLYSETEIQKIIQIKEFRESLGFCLSDVKEFLKLDQNLQQIFAGDPHTDLQTVKEALETIKAQILNIEKKEQSLAKLMAKYKQTYMELEQYYHSLKEEATYQHEED
jgi:Predicted transcriptional regulators